MTMVTGLFRNRDDAERGYHAVLERGYEQADVNLVMSDDTRNRWFPGDRQTDTDLGEKVVPTERSEQYEAGIRDGGILMGVKARAEEDARHFAREWQACGAESVHT
ncbi:MAG TPA: hypothetical protein VGA44_05765 [Steroidobacteraceae bacterium]